MEKKMARSPATPASLDTCQTGRIASYSGRRLTGERIGVQYAEAFKHIELL
jgi:hypothetical protein